MQQYGQMTKRTVYSPHQFLNMKLWIALYAWTEKKLFSIEFNACWPHWKQIRIIHFDLPNKFVLNTLCETVASRFFGHNSPNKHRMKNTCMYGIHERQYTNKQHQLQCIAFRVKRKLSARFPYDNNLWKSPNRKRLSVIENHAFNEHRLSCEIALRSNCTNYNLLFKEASTHFHKVWLAGKIIMDCGSTLISIERKSLSLRICHPPHYIHTDTHRIIAIHLIDFDFILCSKCRCFFISFSNAYGEQCNSFF